VTRSRHEAGGDCPERIVLGVERRPANALNLEIGAPQDRCRCLTPEEWGAADPRAVRWLSSGGSALVLGACTAKACPMPAVALSLPRLDRGIRQGAFTWEAA
jgi:hypothetical protein